MTFKVGEICVLGKRAIVRVVSEDEFIKARNQTPFLIPIEILQVFDYTLGPVGAVYQCHKEELASFFSYKRILKDLL